MPRNSPPEICQCPTCTASRQQNNASGVNVEITNNSPIPNSNEFLCGGCNTIRERWERCNTCEECGRCCRGCFHCDSCETTYTGGENSYCGNCDTCENCCGCINCPNCACRYTSNREDNICTVCNRCGNCGCICPLSTRNSLVNRQQHQQRERMAAKRRKIMESYYARVSPPEPFPAAGSNILRNKAGIVFHQSTTYKENPSHRFTSVEIEVARAAGSGRYVSDRAFNPLTHGGQVVDVCERYFARLVADVSLPATGFEINTAPANGDSLILQLTDICTTLVQSNATCENDFSPRNRMNPCGLHVHCDARDFSYYDLRRLIFLYEKVEPAIYNMLPGHRRASHFCIPCGELYANAIRAGKLIRPNKLRQTKAAKEQLISAVYGRGVQEPNRSDKRSCPQETRYRALNLHSWFHRGTLEFRHFYGTVNLEDIKYWAMTLAGLMDFAYQNSESKILKLTTSRRYAYSILQDTAITKEVFQWQRDQRAKYANVTAQECVESPSLEMSLHNRRIRDILDVPLPQSRHSARDIRIWLNVNGTATPVANSFDENNF